MLIVQGTFRIDPAARAEYLEHAGAQMRTSRAEAGCLEYVLAADPLEADRVVLSERWESRAALDAHIRGLTARAADARASGQAAGPQPSTRDITVYEVTAAEQMG